MQTPILEQKLSLGYRKSLFQDTRQPQSTLKLDVIHQTFIVHTNLLIHSFTNGFSCDGSEINIDFL